MHLHIYLYIYIYIYLRIIYFLWSSKTVTCVKEVELRILAHSIARQVMSKIQGRTQHVFEPIKTFVPRTHSREGKEEHKSLPVCLQHHGHRGYLATRYGTMYIHTYVCVSYMYVKRTDEYIHIYVYIYKYIYICNYFNI